MLLSPGKPNRRGILLGTLFCWALLHPTRTAWGNAFFTLQADGFYAVGNTSYDITFSGTDPTYGNYNGESKLQFNLDAYMVGVSGGVSLDPFPLALKAEYAASFEGDGQTFQDRDWVYDDPAYNDTYGTLVGDTLSTGVITPAQFFQADLQSRLASLGGRDGLRLSAEASFELRQWGTLDVYNFSGTYYQFLTRSGTQPVDTVYTTPVLSYEITTYSYLAGLSLDAPLGRGIRGRIGAGAGFDDFNDTDHHYLRDRVAYGTGSGFVWDLEAEILFSLGGSWVFSGQAGVLDLSATGTETIFEGSPFGAVVNDQVQSFQASFGAGLSFTP